MGASLLALTPPFNYPLMRVLYFDIDGALLDLSEVPKPGLRGAEFGRLLASRGFDSLVCVSGWADLVQTRERGIRAENQKTAIHALLAPLFEDLDWFLERLTLGTDTDRRGRLIGHLHDWFYVDDNADRYYIPVFGQLAYDAESGRRICLATWESDGSEVWEWLEAIPSP